MNMDIKATHLTLTPAIRAFVEEKIGALAKKVARYGESVSAEVEVGMTTKHHKKGPIFRAEVHVRLPGKLVYSESEDLNLYTAIVAAKRDAERQIASYKGAKTKDVRRKGADKRR
jgi:ribosomal subunit interface protein